MIHKFADILNYGGLPLIFILIFLEGNPILGSFVPGQIIVIFIGFFISAFDLFNIYLAFTIVFLAGFLGDLFGFYLGKKHGLKGLKKCGLDSKSQVYNHSKSFFKKFDSWSIILGRQFNLTRAFMPFFAGIFNMNSKKFVFLAIISNILWASLSLAIGYYFGFVIIDRLEFIFGFITFLCIYLAILFFVYASFKKLYLKNYLKIKRYALVNIGISIGLSMVFIFFMIISNFNGEEYINSLFSIFYFPILSKTVMFLPSLNIFLGLFLWFLIALLMLPLKNKYRIIVSMVSGFLISIFMTLIIIFLMKRWFDLSLYPSIIFLTITLFFLSILFSRKFSSKKGLLFFNLFLMILLLFVFLVKFSLTENIYLILLSFLIATVECELIIILSHYKIIDSYFSKLDENVEY